MGLIYRATNEINGKTYIGKTKLTLDRRKSRHKSDSKRNKNISLFHRAINKHGWNNFTWDVLYSGVDYSDKEFQFIISHGGEYNIVKNENMQNTYINNPNIENIRKNLSELRLLVNEELRERFAKNVVDDYNSGISTTIIYKKYKLGRLGFLKIAEKYGLDLKLCRKKYLERVHDKKISNIKDKSQISEKSYLTKLKNLGDVVGVNNPKWSGYWITPIGEFNFIKDASSHIKISQGALRKFCKDENLKPLTIQQIKRNPWLRDNDARVGSTPKQLGFSFHYIK
jgi:group I intron endonuclease